MKIRSINLNTNNFDLDKFFNLDWQNVPELEKFVIGVLSDPTTYPRYTELIDFIDGLGIKIEHNKTKLRDWIWFKPDPGQLANPAYDVLKPTGCLAEDGEVSMDPDCNIHYCRYSYVNKVLKDGNSLKSYDNFESFKRMAEKLADPFVKKMKMCNTCYPSRPLKYEDIRWMDTGLINICNLKCSFCQRNYGEGRFYETLGPDWQGRKLDFDILKREFTPEFMSQLTNITLCGSLGDPVFHPNFLEIVDMIKAPGHIYSTLQSNGTMFTNQFWKELGEKIAGTRIKVQFAIDGGTEESYLRYRKGGNWKKVWEHVASLHKAGGRSVIQYILFRHNENETEQMQKIANRYDAEVKFIHSYSYNDELQPPTKFVRTAGKTCCYSLERQQISLNEQGIVTPCCHTRPFKLTIDNKLFTMFQKEKHLLDLRTSTIKEAIKTDLFHILWTEGKDQSICQTSCLHHRRGGVKKI